MDNLRQVRFPSLPPSLPPPLPTVQRHFFSFYSFSFTLSPLINNLSSVHLEPSLPPSLPPPAGLPDGPYLCANRDRLPRGREEEAAQGKGWGREGGREGGYGRREGVDGCVKTNARGKRMRHAVGRLQSPSTIHLLTSLLPSLPPSLPPPPPPPVHCRQGQGRDRCFQSAK